MAKPLTEDQRGRVAEKIMEGGNLVFVALAVGQIVPGTVPFRLGIAVSGVVVLAIAYLVAIYIMKGGRG